MKKGGKGIAAILAMPVKGKAKEGGEPVAEEVDDDAMSQQAELDAAQSVLDALGITGGDAAALNQALKDHRACCE